jgi:hypothetical protein
MFESKKGLHARSVATSKCNPAGHSLCSVSQANKKIIVLLQVRINSGNLIFRHRFWKWRQPTFGLPVLSISTPYSGIAVTVERRNNDTVSFLKVDVIHKAAVFSSDW